MVRSRTTGSGHRRTAKSRLAIFALAFLLLFVPVVAFAQLTTADLGLQYGTSLGLTTTDIRTTVGRIINAFFGLLGIIVVVIMLYAGFLWMTARGEAEQVDKAKKILINAVIGLAILLSAYAITAFIFNAITGATLRSTFTPTGGQQSSLDWLSGGSTGLLGNGIIEYHYPEVGQTDVPRNTRVSITFKRPLKLSTVFADYDDNGTFTTTDDKVSGVAVTPTTALKLNTDNFRIVPALNYVPTGTTFDFRYPLQPFITNAPAGVTPVTAVYSPENQTLTITFVGYIGSPVANVNYRVAIRGGDDGVKVWMPNPSGADPVTKNAFDSSSADGGYSWPFTTGTFLDLTPPQIVAVIPTTVANPTDIRNASTPRNQLLQIYFNEAVDPTSASGVLPTFTNLEVKAQCVGTDCDRALYATYATVPGTFILGNRYRTAEFTASSLCEGVSTNSCGDPVYCLPKNVDLRVRAIAALVDSANPPQAAATPAGIMDMAGNSLDGNRNGAGDGRETDPAAGTDFNLNVPQTNLAGIKDNVKWEYRVGTDIDLVPPTITLVDPPSYDSNSTSAPPREDTLYSATPPGPSKFPVSNNVIITWSKAMSVGSFRTGAWGTSNDFADSTTTMALRSKELEKTNRGTACTTEASCPYRQLDPPFFYLNTLSSGMETQILHRNFLTANDLGYTEEEMTSLPSRTPIYEPVIGSKVRDTRQNCFYPSKGYGCNVQNPPIEVLGIPQSSCCNRTAQGTFACEP